MNLRRHRKTRAPSKLLCSGIAITFTASLLVDATAANADPPPPAVNITDASYYMLSNSVDIPYAYGCKQARQDIDSGYTYGHVILDFGGQDGALTGSVLINGTPISKKEIEDSAEGFIAGYNICSYQAGDMGNLLFLGIGTNNSATNGSAAGTAWHTIVSDIDAWANSGASSDPNVTLVLGANDMEPGFGAVAATRAWADAYGNYLGADYYDFGSADGCPTSAPDPGASPNGSCSGGWTQDDEWYLSYGNYTGEPVPEIYFPDMGNQWAAISQYGKANKDWDLAFSGPLEEHPLDSSTDDAATAYYDLSTSLSQFGVDTSMDGIVYEIQHEPSTVSTEKVMSSLISQTPNTRRSGANASSARMVPPRLRTRVAQLRKRADEWRRTHPGATVSVRAGLEKARSENPSPPRRVAGIQDMHQGPFSGGTFLTRNVYQGPSGKSWLLAYAGAVRDPVVRYPDHGSDGRGAIRLYVQDDVRGTTVPLGTFAAPSGTGSLRIISRQGDKLNLTSARGTRFQFDLGSHQITEQ